MTTEPIFDVEVTTVAGVFVMKGAHADAQRLVNHINDPQPLLSCRARPHMATNVSLPIATIDQAQEQLLALITVGGDEIATMLSPEQPLAILFDALLPHWRPMMLSMLDQLG